MKKLLSLLLALIIVTITAISTSAYSVNNTQVGADYSVSDELLNAVQVNVPFEITKDDISIDFYEEIAQDKILIMYSVADEAFSAAEVEKEIGDYLLVTPDSQLPEVFANGVLYDMKQAYETGVLTDENLDVIATIETNLFSFEKNNNSEITYENYYAGDYKYEQEWLDEYVNFLFGDYDTHRVYGYKELYTNEEEGWTLIEASNLCNQPWEVSFVLDDLLFYPLHDAPPFKTGYAVYEDGEFKDITEIDLDNYTGIKDELIKSEEVTRIKDNDTKITYENYYAGDYKYEQVWLDKYADSIFSEYETYRGYGYRELYTSEEEGWTLIEASNLLNQPWMVKGVVDDLVFYPLHDAPPFKTGYAVYEDGEFKDISEINLDNYTGIKDELAKFEEVMRIGDNDFDGKVTILDATKIQRVMAKLDSFDTRDDIFVYMTTFGTNVNYISDVDRDGERTILDATAIQRKLAQID